MDSHSTSAGPTPIHAVVRRVIDRQVVLDWPPAHRPLYRVEFPVPPELAAFLETWSGGTDLRLLALQHCRGKGAKWMRHDGDWTVWLRYAPEELDAGRDLYGCRVILETPNPDRLDVLTRIVRELLRIGTADLASRQRLGEGPTAPESKILERLQRAARNEQALRSAIFGPQGETRAPDIRPFRAETGLPDIHARVDRFQPMEETR